MDARKTEQLAAMWTGAQRTVGSYIATLVGDYHVAEDLLQRVAVVLVRKFDEYDPAKPFAAWAIGVAKYEVLAWRRGRAMERHVFDDALVERITESYQRIGGELSPMREALEHCLDRLDGKARRAIELRYTEAQDPAAIGVRLAMTDGAVRMLLMRTRQKLRACIEGRTGGAGGIGDIGGAT